MYAHLLKGIDIASLSREEMIKLINKVYNYDTTRSYVDYGGDLNRLPDSTLATILRIFKREFAELSPNIIFVRHFIQRVTLSATSISRFAALTEDCFFEARNELKERYGLESHTYGFGPVVAGFLDLEDKVPQMAIPKKKLMMMLIAVGWLNNVGTRANYRGSEYGSGFTIQEDAFTEYLQSEQTEDHYHQIISAICSGQNYPRFIELIESINGGTSKPLLTGIL